MIKKFLLIPIIFGGTCLSVSAKIITFKQYYSQEDLYWINTSGLIGLAIIILGYNFLFKQRK